MTTIVALDVGIQARQGLFRRLRPREERIGVMSNLEGSARGLVGDVRASLPWRERQRWWVISRVPSGARETAMAPCSSVRASVAPVADTDRSVRAEGCP